MKKRILSILILAALSIVSAFGAYAEAPLAPNENAYRNAKEAVSLISYGEYGMALQRLSLTHVMTAQALKSYIDINCREIYRGSVQTEVSVAWFDGMIWNIAVPFEAPDDEAVGALVFQLQSPEQFSSVYFMRWGDVQASYSMSRYVYWNVEYIPNYVIVADW